MEEGEFIEFKTGLKRCSDCSSLDQLQELLTHKFGPLADTMTYREEIFFVLYKSLFYGIPISNFILNIFLAYLSSGAFSDSLIFTIPYVATSTIPSFVASLVATHSTAEDIYDELYRKKANKRSFLKNTYPVVNLAVTALSLVFAGGASSWGITVTKEILGDSPLSAAIPLFASTAALGTVIFESFAMRDFVNDILMTVSGYWGNAYMKQKIFLSEKLTRVAEWLSE